MDPASYLSPAGAPLGNMPLAEMAAVSDVVSRSYTMIAVARAGRFVPLHVSVLRTENGERHIFVWEA